MIKTTYTCDKCDHEQDNSEQMWGIGIILKHHGSEANYSDTPKVKELWCRACVVGLGLLPAKARAPSETPLPEPPTFEEMIREIVREETLEAAENI